MCDGIYLTDTGHQDVMMHLQTNSVRMVTYSNVQVVIEQETAPCRILSWRYSY